MNDYGVVAALLGFICGLFVGLMAAMSIGRKAERAKPLNLHDARRAVQAQANRDLEAQAEYIERRKGR